MHNGIVISNFTFLVQLVKRLIKGIHAMLGRTFHQVLELMHLALLDQFRHQRGIQQNFNNRPAAITIGCPDQLLGNNALKVK